MDNAKEVVKEVQEEFAKRFGHRMFEVEPYKLDDADVAIVALGSMCGTVKYVVNKMREEGKKVGLLKITMFRPFPAELVRNALKDVPVIGVFDRSSCLGNNNGPLWNEVAGALTGVYTDIRHYIGGLGGRDIPVKNVEKMFNELLEIKEGKRESNTEWIDVKDNAMELRELIVVSK